MTCHKSYLWRWLPVAVVAMLALPSSGVASPTSGAIFGRVVDRGTRQPLDGVTVVASGPQGDQATLTDAKGQYELRGLPIGDYLVRFSCGEVSIESSATVLMDQTVTVNARLRSSPEGMETVVVAQRAPAIDVGSTRVGHVDPRVCRERAQQPQPEWPSGKDARSLFRCGGAGVVRRNRPGERLLPRRVQHHRTQGRRLGDQPVRALS